MWKQAKERYVCIISICVCTQPRHNPVIRWAICRVVFHIMMSWHPWYVFTMLLFYSNITEGFAIWFVLLQFCWFALLMSNCTSFENIFRSSIFFYLFLSSIFSSTQSFTLCWYPFIYYYIIVHVHFSFLKPSRQFHTVRKLIYGVCVAFTP